ncbi:MAG: M20 aminoacylase family protein, partial [Bauldia sp.]
MPIVNRIAEFHDDIAAWRQDLHRYPEILYEVHRTAASVAERLREFGVDEIATGIGRTGVVGVIRGRHTKSGKVIGLRADMDALPIREETGKPYASTIEGKMHACGHDGHTAMLLGAARYLAETRNFDGTAIVIFQPAEEGGGGGRAMVEDGLMERWRIGEVYGMHNLPGMPVGAFGIRKGPLLAATDEFRIDITGYGAHAAKPHLSVDPIIVGTTIVQALQTIVSRSVDPVESAVVSVTRFHAGDARNIIAPYAEVGGTVRTLDAGNRDLVEKRMREILGGIASAFGATIDLDYDRNYPVTRNPPKQTDFAADVAAEVVGESRVDRDTPPIMGGEDFAYMLEAR